MIVDLVDTLDILVGPRSSGARSGIRRILPGENNVVGRKRLAVVPGHALLEPPGNRRAVLGQPAVVKTGNLCGQNGYKVSVRVKRRQWLVDHAGGIRVLLARGQMDIENGWGLPPQQAQLTS